MARAGVMRMAGKLCLALAFCCVSLSTTKLPADDMLLVVGAGGADEYTEMFAEWAEKWQLAANEAKINCQVIGIDGTNDHEELQASLSQQGAKSDESPLWLVLIGHGTYDRKTAKFNLRGKDVDVKELQNWLQKLSRPLILINGFSCSGAFLEPLHAPNRVVITATKNGAELNFSRFAGFLAESMVDMTGDLDHDDQVSLLEAFLLASSKVNEFYASDGRLVTEHALLEDNQDGKGISADFFKGIRAQATAKDGSNLDGNRAHRYIIKSSPKAATLTPEDAAKRDRLESKIEELRAKKKGMSEDDYYRQLEVLLVTMAELYEKDGLETKSGHK